MAKFATAVGPQATKWPHNMASEQNKKKNQEKGNARPRREAAERELRAERRREYENLAANTFN